MGQPGYYSDGQTRVTETMTQSKTANNPSGYAADVEEVTRIYIDSWNAGFGQLLSQADRTVTADLVGTLES